METLKCSRIVPQGDDVRRARESMTERDHVTLRMRRVVVERSVPSLAPMTPSIMSVKKTLARHHVKHRLRVVCIRGKHP